MRSEGVQSRMRAGRIRLPEVFLDEIGVDGERGFGALGRSHDHPLHGA